jgi:hypothetical protein
MLRGSSIAARAIEIGQVINSRTTDPEGSEAAAMGCKSSLLHFV